MITNKIWLINEHKRANEFHKHEDHELLYPIL